jgi:N-formylglutamate amidohydrolase
MKPKCRLIGENGNIFNLMGIVSQTLKQAGEHEKADEMVKRITTEAKSYDEALAMLMEYVDVE